MVPRENPHRHGREHKNHAKHFTTLPTIDFFFHMRCVQTCEMAVTCTAAIQYSIPHLLPTIVRYMNYTSASLITVLMDVNFCFCISYKQTSLHILHICNFWPLILTVTNKGANWTIQFISP